MSALTELVVKETSTPLADRLAAAEARIPVLRHRRWELLADLEAANDETADKITEELSAVTTQLEEAQRQIEDLKGVIQVEGERVAAKDAAAAAKLRASQVASVLQHLTYRDRAADAFQKALKELVSSYRELVLQAEKSRNAFPADARPRTGLLTAYGELLPLIEEEMFRQGGLIDGKSNFNLPGAKQRDIRLMGNPKGVEPLSDKLRANTAFVKRYLNGEVT